jgi:hypothetical protein
MKHRILLPFVFVTGHLLAQVTYDRLLHAGMRANVTAR